MVVSNDEIKEADKEFTPDTYDDLYINMELAVPGGDNPNPQYEKVTKQLRDAHSIPIGMANENPILDSRMYEVEYQDGTKASLAVNYIAENLFAQVDQEGKRHVLLDEIIDYRVNGHEVKLQDAFITTGTGMRIHNWVGTPGPVERWKHKLDIIKGSQRILSSPTSRICCCGKDCHGTCLCLVGSAYVEKEKPNHIKGKVKILA